MSRQDHRFNVPTGAAGFIQSTDWRELSGASATLKAAQAAPMRRPAQRRKPDTRPAPLRDEMNRAREVIGVARSAVEQTFADIRFGRKIDVARLSPVVESIAASMSRNPIAIPSLTRLKQRHEYTYLHSVAVCGLMIGLARELEFDPALDFDIGMAGLLHDVGKAHVPRMLLDKPDPLNEEEFDLVRAHAVRGHEMLTDTGVAPEIALDVALNHHERMDGTGYPGGRTAEQLSIHARMGAICDVYDAVTSARAYKAAWSPGEALEWMSAAPGHFDRSILSVFSHMMGAFPIGALVRLSSDRLGVVLDEPDSDPLSPPVGVFHCAVTRRPLSLARIVPGSDIIVGIESPERWAFAGWNAMRADILNHFAATQPQPGP